jgi:hypothetical protein
MNSQQQNPMENINIYKPQGKGTLLSELIKDKKDDTQNSKIQSNEEYDEYADYGNDEREKEPIKHKKNRLIQQQPHQQPQQQQQQLKKQQIIRHHPLKHKNQIKKNSESHKVSDYVLPFFELIILLTIYVIMSQSFVVSFLSKYIAQLNPSDEGELKMSGIIIYGFIMAVLFLVIRKIVFSKL